MAEARQAVAFQFAVTEEGVQVHFDKDAVKSAIKALAGFSRSRVSRARYMGIFPASPLSLVAIGGALGGSALAGKDVSLGLNTAIVNLLQ